MITYNLCLYMCSKGRLVALRSSNLAVGTAVLKITMLNAVTDVVRFVVINGYCQI